MFRQYLYNRYANKNLPEITGTMKRHHQFTTDSSTAATKTVILKDPTRQQRAKQIIEKYQQQQFGLLLPNNQNRNLHNKSVHNSSISAHERPSSVKIVKPEPHVGTSGTHYLFLKSEKENKPNHPQRKHLTEPRPMSSGAKKSHFQRKHYNPTETELAKQKKCEEPVAAARNILDTDTAIRVKNDLMSCIPENQYRRQEPAPTTGALGWNHRPRNSLNLMHKTSYEANLEPQKVVQNSKLKNNELKGNGLDKEPVVDKVRRDDYRKSSIVLG